MCGFDDGCGTAFSAGKVDADGLALALETFEFHLSSAWGDVDDFAADVADEESHGNVGSAIVVATIFELWLNRGFDDDSSFLALAGDHFGREDKNSAVGDDFADALFADRNGNEAIALHWSGKDPGFFVVRDEAGSVDRAAGFEADAGVFDRSAATSGVEGRFMPEDLGEQKAHQEDYCQHSDYCQHFLHPCSLLRTPPLRCLGL